MRLLAMVLFLLVTSAAHAAVLTETRIICDQELQAYLDTQGDPHVVAHCVTTDNNGTVIRGSREVDITNKLTTQQKNGVQNILEQLKAFAAGSLSIPTPTPTSTP